MRKPVDDLIDKIIAFIKGKLKGLGKGKKGKKESADQTKKDMKKDKDGVTAADKRKHKQIGGEVKKKLIEPVGKNVKTFEEFYKVKTKQARALEKKHQKHLKKGIRIKISFGNVEKEKRDGDIDFKVDISPNNFLETIQAIFGFKKKEAEAHHYEFDVEKINPDSQLGKLTTMSSKKYGKLTKSATKYDQAYLAQVIAIPSENYRDLPGRYREQAFGSGEEADKRFSLVIGINKYDNLDGTNKAQVKKSTTMSWAHFPVGLIGFIWEPTWTKIGKDEQNKEVSRTKVRVKEVRKAMKKMSPQTRAQTKAAEKKITAAGSTKIPYGGLRSFASQHSITRGYTAGLKKNAADVYVHIADGDTMSLKVRGEGAADLKDIFKDFDVPLFTAYDKIIKEHSKGKKPSIVSGGYRFKVEPKGNANFEKDQLRAIANQIDQEYRQAAAKADPSILYFPEPNTIVKIVGKGLEVSFGVGYKEGETLVNNLIKKRGLKKDDMVYDTRAAITTDGERFGAKLSGQNGDVAVNGEVLTYLAATDTVRGKDMTLDEFRAMFQANQMHATRSKFVTRILERYSSPELNKGYEKILKKGYNNIFPHVKVLGQKMTNQSAWLKVKGQVQQNKVNIDSSALQAFKLALETFYLENKTKNNVLSAEHKDEIEKIHGVYREGSGAILTSFKKLIGTVNPK